MIYLWWVGGAFLWLVVGSIIVGIDDAMSEPGKRVLKDPKVNPLFIFVCIIIWPLVLVLTITYSTFEFVVALRDKTDNSKPVSQDWDQDLRS